MKKRETSRAVDKELLVNNKLFLNPERVSMPDIDVDIADDRRQEVIDYVSKKYGEDHVSRIITFGTLAAKMSVKDVGRTLDMPLTLTQQIADAIPAEPKITLDRAYEDSPMFKELYDGNEDVRTIVDIARKIEGVSRNVSQHACGVVIAKNPIADNIPEILLKDANGNPTYTAAFQKDEVEENGCIKFDFLGLRNMSILKNASDSLNIDYQNIPLFDPRVYEYIGRGDTDGIFQIESPGMKNLMKDMFFDIKEKIADCKNDAELHALGVECFERLIAAISLFRPGPIDSIPDYIAGMRDVHNIHYDTPELKPILKTTYGVICYQEQVQQICRSLAGYSYGRADLIRRGMAKKKPEIIEREKAIFLYGNKKDYDAGKDDAYVPGCINNGIDEQAALIIWAKMEKFAEYAFNKSHAAGYAVISVRTAWLKYYYPVVFWTETLNSVINKADKIRKYLYCAQQHGITILPPSVNNSKSKFSHEGRSIRIGLTALRDLGKASLPILEERANGEFADFKDFLNRCTPGKKVLTSLAYSGAMDEFNLSRHEIVENCENISDYFRTLTKYDSWADFDELNELYNAMIDVNIDHYDEYPKQEKLNYEYNYAGMYVSEHPIDEYHEAIDALQPDCVVDLQFEKDDTEEVNYRNLEMKCKVIGIVKNIELKKTRKGEDMITGTIEDKTSNIRFTVFAKQLAESTFNRELLVENNIIVMDGVRKVNDFGSQIIVNAVSNISTFREYCNEIFCGTDFDHIDELINVARDCEPGPLTLVIRIMDLTNKFGKPYAYFVDEATGKRVPISQRNIKDPRNLRVSAKSFMTLRELSKQCKMYKDYYYKRSSLIK